MSEEPIAERSSGHAMPSAASAGPLSWYEKQKQTEGFRADPAQERAATRLQQLFDELIEFKSYRGRMFMKTFGRREPPRGLYIHGSVGRGKSMLMDAFYSQLTVSTQTPRTLSRLHAKHPSRTRARNA